MKKTGLKDYRFSIPIVMCAKVTPDDKPTTSSTHYLAYNSSLCVSLCLCFSPFLFSLLHSILYVII